jgi:hypothetical protein
VRQVARLEPSFWRFVERTSYDNQEYRIRTRKHMPAATLAAAIKAIRLYTSTEWELFVEEWLRGLRKRYSDVKRLGGSGDLGRDVIAFTDDKKLEGIWDHCRPVKQAVSADKGMISHAILAN